MSALSAWLYTLAVLAAMALLGWAGSVARRNVGLVDSLWGLFFAAAALSYALLLQHPGPRTALVLALVLPWSLRLTAHVTWRNWGEPEDRRYAAICARNEPGFALKSLYRVFGLQALLAALVSLPLLGAIASPIPLRLLDGLGVALWALGLSCEALADLQLARFKADPANRSAVMDRGLWRYSRHPNYFGDFCV